MMANCTLASRFASHVGMCFLITAIAGGCSSSSEETAAGDDGGALDADSPRDASAPKDAAPSPTDAGVDAAPADPCASPPGAANAQVKKMEKLSRETPAGGAPKSGLYSLEYWGKQTGTVGIAYELAVNLRLTIGSPNTFSVSEYYMASEHSGGGTFTFDPTTHAIEFTKTCGEVNVGLGATDKGFYSLTATELKVFNFGLYGAGDILIFSAPP